jgi:hypothetical protein
MCFIDPVKQTVLHTAIQFKEQKLLLINAMTVKDKECLSNCMRFLQELKIHAITVMKARRKYWSWGWNANIFGHNGKFIPIGAFRFVVDALFSFYIRTTMSLFGKTVSKEGTGLNTRLDKMWSFTGRSIKLLVVATLVLLLTGVAAKNCGAQLRRSSGLDLSLQGGLDFPVGDSGLVKSGSYNFTFTGYMPVSQLLDITVGIGYQKLGQTDQKADSGKTVTNIPVFAGIRFVFDGSTVLPYFGGEFSVNDLVFHATNGVSSIPDITNTRLGYAIVVGTRIPFNRTWGADVTIKYHDIPGASGDPDSRFISVEAGLIAHLDL